MLSNLALLMFAIAAMILVPCMATYSDQAYRAQAVDLESRSTNQLRRLRAAQKTANIRSRSTDQPWLHDDVELHEMDDVDDQGGPLSAKVHATPKLPVLFVEGLESELSYVECDEASVELGFVSSQPFKRGSRELRDTNPFALITAHYGCNDVDDRGVRIVRDVAIDEARQSILLTTSSASWKDILETFKIGFGPHDDSVSMRTQHELRKRQAVGTSAAATFSPTISIPAPPSSSPTPEADTVTKALDIHYLDTPILPPDIPGVDGATLRGSEVLQGVTVKCKNCTVRGNLELSEGTFTLDTDSSSSEFMNETENIVQFFREGYVKFVAKSFSAHIELDTTVKPNALTEIQIPLPQVGIPGFQIPGVAAIGPILNPSLVLSIALSTELQFTYGFDVSVPDNSEILIDIANVTNSSVTGFPESTVTALPLQAGINDISLTFSAAFKPEILLGISVLNGQGTAGAGVLLTLPRLEAQFSQVANVDHLCNPLNTTNNNLQNDNFTSLTNIVPSVNFDLELIAQAEVKAGQFRFGENVGYTVTSKQFTLPTACFSYDADKNSYITAEAAVETGKDGEVEKKKSGGVVRITDEASIIRVAKRVGTLWTILGLSGIYILLL